MATGRSAFFFGFCNMGLRWKVRMWGVRLFRVGCRSRVDSGSGLMFGEGSAWGDVVSLIGLFFCY